MNKTEPGGDTLRRYNTIALTRTDRLLTITLNRPESRNAINLELHQELADVFVFAAADEHSDVVVLTGAGPAFSAGGDLEHIATNAANPELFDNEVRLAKRIVFAMLDLDKPLICRLNGHAVGLGATLALLCDVIFAADTAKIGDPHVALGLVAGGVALDQFVSVDQGEGFVVAMAVLTIGAGALLAIVGTVRWVRIDAAMRAGRPLEPSKVIVVVGVLTAVLGLLVALILALA